MKINQIASIITKAVSSYEGAQKNLVLDIVRAAIGALENGAEGVAVYKETMLASKEGSDCKNVRHYFAVLANNVKYVAQVKDAKTLSGMGAQINAMHALAIKEHDVKMAKEKADALEAADALQATAQAEAKAAQALQATAEKDNATEAQKAKAEAAAKAAQAAKEAAAKAAIDAEKIAVAAAKAEGAAQRLLEKEEAKAAKQVTATAPAGKGEELKPAPQPQAIPKMQVTDVGAMAAELASCAAELADTWGTYSTGKPSKTIAAKIGTLINRMAATSAELAKATK